MRYTQMDVQETDSVQVLQSEMCDLTLMEVTPDSLGAVFILFVTSTLYTSQ